MIMNVKHANHNIALVRDNCKTYISPLQITTNGLYSHSLRVINHVAIAMTTVERFQFEM